MNTPMPIRISRAGRLGRAEMDLRGHRVTVLSAGRSAIAAAALAVRATLGTDPPADAAEWASGADRAAARAAGAAGCGVMVNVDGDIALAGDGPPQGWAVKLTGGGGEPTRIHLRHGGLATAHSWSGATTWRSVTVMSSSCEQAWDLADQAVRRGREAPMWLGTLGVAARLTRSVGGLVLAGQWPAETVAA